ncbi:MAG TPA: hypothetical protein VF476_01160 [Chitinophagaceae bacterium]
MSTYHQLNPLTNSQQSVCGYGGLAGILLAATCMVQLFVYGTSHWIVPVLLSVYLFAVISFFLLSLQKSVAPLLLIISAVLILGAEVVWILSNAFSLVVVLLFVYNAVIVVFLYIEQIPKKLKQKQLALKAEKELWEGKI